MATIKSQMVLNDGMSAVLRKITSALDTTLAAFEQMQRASGEAIELATIEAARGELVGARQATDQWAESFSRAAEEEEKLNRGIERGTSATDGMLKKVVSLAGAYAGFSSAKNFALDAMGAADVQIGAQVQLQTVLNNMGAEESYRAMVGAMSGTELEGSLGLDTSGALDSFQRLAERVDGVELGGSFALDTGRAWGEYERLAQGIGGAELGVSVALDTRAVELPAQTEWPLDTEKAVKKYEALQRNLNGAKLGTAFSLDTTGAVEAYETMVNGFSGPVLSLDTGEAWGEYGRFAGEIEGKELGNTLFLDTAGAAVGYRLFADNLAGAQGVELQVDTGPAMTAYDAILAKASEIQSRGMYGDEAMIAGAAEFATYFSDANAILSMMDTLADYSAGMSGGAALNSQAMVDYATGLGKIMSGSYDAMNEKGFQFTDTQKAIIEGTANQAQIVAELGAGYLDMSQDMQAAAVINSVIAEGWGGLYEAMSNTPVGQITQLENALGDVKENIGAGIYPAFLRLVQTVQKNLPQIESVALGVAGVLSTALNILTGMTQGALAFGGAVADNWGIIGPLVYGIVAALAAYAGYLGVTKAAELASAAVKTVLIAAEYAHAAATGVAVAKTTAQTAAQMGLNTALLACPVTWIVLGIIALIAVVYAAVAAFNKFAGTSLSATGVIMAGFSMLGAFLVNYFVAPLQNHLAAAANFVGNVFHNPVGAVKVLFYDMCLTVLGYIQSLAVGIETLLNRIPGVTIDITSGLDGFYAQLEQAQQAVKDESGVGKMDYMDYAEAADRGYAFGEKLGDSVSDFFGGGLGAVDDLLNNFQNMPGNQFGLDGLMEDVGGIAEDTGGIAGSLSVSSEELKYLRDIAERDHVNRFTTAEVKIDMTGMTNKIEGEADLDGVLRRLTDGFAESLVTAAEGAHV